MATNVTHEVKGNKLIVTMDISKAQIDRARPSSSGKTMIVASTEGSVKVEGPNGSNLSYSINLMNKPA